MRRREFIGVIGGAAAWPLAVQAQQRPMPVIGVLSASSFDDSATVLQMQAFRQGLKSTGFEEGGNVAIEYRWAAGHYDQLAAFADDLVQRKVAVIFAHAASNAVQAAKAATSVIPIVFVYGGDPIKQGIVASLNRPGGNVTGAQILTVELVPKRLEFLSAISPSEGAIGVLLNPTNITAESQRNQLEGAARALGRQLIVANASSANEFAEAFASFARERAGGVVISSDVVFNTHSEQLATHAARHMTPAAAEVRAFPAAGGLMSYGTNFNNVNRVAGKYVGQILKGAKPADLPVILPTKFDLVINLKAAKALGVEIPATLFATADEMIE